MSLHVSKSVTLDELTLCGGLSLSFQDIDGHDGVLGSCGCFGLDGLDGVDDQLGEEFGIGSDEFG